MAKKKQSGILNYFLIGMVVVCLGLILFEISSNTLSGLQPSGTADNYMVNSDKLPVYETSVSAPVQAAGTPMPTSDDLMNQYSDTGE